MTEVSEAAPSAAVEQLIDPGYLAQLRVQMLKFAQIQLGDPYQAEDAVQEALIGALKNAGSFARKSALKTWVFSILKFKIADIFREQKKLIATSAQEEDSDEAAFSGLLFKDNGHWHKSQRPTAWEGPQGGAYSADFWRVFDACLNGLPEQQARVFMLREFIELESDEICNRLNLTTSNLHVTLYRARLRLRQCLESSWFASESAEQIAGEIGL
ncbi:sigma-70 family RNA polymerase sigma factor [Microbulbifer aggregans]|uniref:sigma-70 family RNA polymerase sigma factor n=1 Tax=Microbulbifer aggregans TaxID=1769779 RepID=UPI001CFEBE0E|nr:sigma-70 family RNA polymerase sigma factor [Microbulbifer aggregans]